MKAARLLIAASLSVATSAFPATIKNLDFNVDGVLPTSQPDIRLHHIIDQSVLCDMPLDSLLFLGFRLSLAPGNPVVVVCRRFLQLSVTFVANPILAG